MTTLAMANIGAAGLPLAPRAILQLIRDILCRIYNLQDWIAPDYARRLHHAMDASMRGGGGDWLGGSREPTSRADAARVELSDAGEHGSLHKALAVS